MPETLPLTPTPAPYSLKDHFEKDRRFFLMAGAGLVGVLLFALVGLGVYYSTSQRSYDDTGRAFLSQGVSELSLSNPANISPVVGQPVNVALTYNSNQAPVSGIQVVVEVTHGSLGDVTFQPANVSGLQVIASVTENISGGKKLLLAFGSNPITAPFNTGNTPVTLGTFQYTQPNTTGVRFEFKSETRTTATTSGNDTLKTPNPLSQTYNLKTTSASPSPTAVALASPTSTPTAIPAGASPTPTIRPASPTPTPFTATVTPSPTPIYFAPTPTPVYVATNNTVTTQCNAYCTSNSQCPTNTACVGNYCRNPFCTSAMDCVCTANNLNPSPVPQVITQTTVVPVPTYVPTTTYAPQQVIYVDQPSIGGPVVQQPQVTYVDPSAQTGVATTGDKGAEFAMGGANQNPSVPIAEDVVVPSPTFNPSTAFISPSPVAMEQTSTPRSWLLLAVGIGAGVLAAAIALLLWLQGRTSKPVMVQPSSTPRSMVMPTAPASMPPARPTTASIPPAQPITTSPSTPTLPPKPPGA
jgi:hypothetical protein